MKIDTEMRRVTKPGANLFLELGFPPAEAKRLHALSRKHINDTRRLKRQLMDELSSRIAERHLRLDRVGTPHDAGGWLVLGCREMRGVTEASRAL